jgi:hypothetical protein
LKSKKGLFRIKSYYFNNHMQTWHYLKVYGRMVSRRS